MAHLGQADIFFPVFFPCGTKPLRVSTRIVRQNDGFRLSAPPNRSWTLGYRVQKKCLCVIGSLFGY